ncbi:hypothetical protein ACODYM_11145 [Burkholderia gladioli]|uniref:hypothetical protein n=1 Tax=Burkholderia gladioli TaxID=28095 RepID=UPI00163DECE8|nr:hypothetical protein [Burkholderia gladioli]
MAKRELTPEYRAGASAFADLINNLPGSSAGPYFSEIATQMRASRIGWSGEWPLGFDEAVGCLIDEGVMGIARRSAWSPMRELEDPDWWRE